MDLIYSTKNESCIIDNNMNNLSIKNWLIIDASVSILITILMINTIYNSFNNINMTDNIFDYNIIYNIIIVLILNILLIYKVIWLIIGSILIFYYNKDCKFIGDTKVYLYVSIIIKLATFIINVQNNKSNDQ
jgi:hypothetical protein